MKHKELLKSIIRILLCHIALSLSMTVLMISIMKQINVFLIYFIAIVLWIFEIMFFYFLIDILKSRFDILKKLKPKMWIMALIFLIVVLVGTHNTIIMYATK